ncbi:MAG: hypothetical protein HY720_17730 [Planctomycetes bacterium]|nr:hypothetical protein [Planctomycetota bacterium]
MVRIARSFASFLLVVLPGLGLVWLVFAPFARRNTLHIAFMFHDDPSRWGWMFGEESRPDPRGGDEADRLTWKAYQVQGEERVDLLARACEARPGDPELLGVHFVAVLAVGMQEEEPARAERGGEVEEAGNRALEADPENSLYELGEAAFLFEDAFEEDESAKDEPSRLRLVDRPRAERAAVELLRAASRGSFSQHLGKTNLLALARRVDGEPDNPVGRIGLWAATELPILGSLKDGLIRAGRYASILHSEGRTEEAQRIWEAGIALALQQEVGAATIIELLVGVAVERRLRRERIDAWIAEGNAAAVDREWRILRAVEAKREEAMSLPEGTELSEFGLLDRALAPAGGWVRMDPAHGRRLDYRALVVVALALLAVLLVLGAGWNAALAAWARGVEPQSVGGPAPCDVAAAVALWALVPVAGFLFLDRFHPTRATGLAEQPGLFLQPIALALSVTFALWAWARKYRPPAPGRVLTTIEWGAFACVVPGAFLSLFFTGADGSEPDPLRPVVWAAILLAGSAITGALAVVVGGWLRRSGHWTGAFRPYRRALALSFGAGALAALVVAASFAIPSFRRAERIYAREVLDPVIEDELSVSRWDEIRKLDREKAAREER